jgi:hypothetical protein
VIPSAAWPTKCTARALFMSGMAAARDASPGRSVPASCSILIRGARLDGTIEPDDCQVPVCTAPSGRYLIIHSRYLLLHTVL